MDVVVVESPAKAKTINKYLGKDYHVLASFGHVRDLPAKDGSVRPEENFAMSWELGKDSKKHIDEIKKALKDADGLILATDPDREGEAISWHIYKVLEDENVLEGKDVKRVVFNEITRDAINDAMNHPRDLDHNLVEAYLARRALDYLVGFTLSPVLWRKLPGAKSAGRVQSVALRLICERETEIENFVPQEYWTVHARMATPEGTEFKANLTHLDGTKLDKFDLGNEQAAKRAVAAIEDGRYTVAEVQKKKTQRKPPPPFTTSTMQQEAARKLYFNAERTMRTAQKLYEGIDVGGEVAGLITYMRTDGVTMAAEAVHGVRNHIKSEFGDKYLPDNPRMYKTASKNAQEAHEAIRPTDASRTPEAMRRYLNDDQAKLYELIWKRTVASQMENAILDQVAVDIKNSDGQVILRANGSVIAFDGFLKLYQEGRDDDEAEKDGDERMLPPMKEGDALQLEKVEPEQHFTQPPPRYTEASLVKKLEELGIGRPSTYASILSVLRQRNYVTMDKRRFIPESRGRLVTAFLTNFFNRYVQYNFTAELENQLDDISGGRIDWTKVLEDFWEAFSEAVDETRDLRIKEVLDVLDETLGSHFFRPDESGKDPRKCPECEDGRLSIKLGKFGAFVGCSNYPDCRFTRPLTSDAGEGAAGPNGLKELGKDPETGLPVTLRKGPYGWYVQLGEKDDEKKPKRTAMPRTMDPADVELETALKLLSLPREVGEHPETGDKITAGIGRYGPFIKMNSQYVSLKGEDDVLSVGLNRAVSLLADAKDKGPKELGAHPDDGKPVTLRKGRYGPYLQHGQLRAPVPKDTEPGDVTLEQAVQVLAEKAEKSKSGGKSGGKSGKKTTKSKKAAAKESKDDSSAEKAGEPSQKTDEAAAK